MSPFEIKNRVRLACRALVRARAVFSLPTTPAGEDRILEEGISRAVSFQPAIKKYYLHLSADDFKRETSIGKIIKDALLQRGIKKPLIDFNCLKKLPALLGKNTTGVTALVKKEKVLEFEPGDSTDHSYGLAVGIGTTTVVGYLFDLTHSRRGGLGT